MMHCHFRGLMFAAPAAIGIVLSTPISAMMANENYAVADVTLGMDIDRVLKIYPSAQTDARVPNCYRYGKAVWDTSVAGPILRHRDEVSELTLGFTSSRNHNRLIRIVYDRRVDPAKFDFRALLGKLTKQYGPYDRILHRRKMEPAGRVIGYLWQSPGYASLRVVLHEDFRTPSDRYRLSFLARTEAATRKQTRCTSAQCSPCITP